MRDGIYAGSEKTEEIAPAKATPEATTIEFDPQELEVLFACYDEIVEQMPSGTVRGEAALQIVFMVAKKLGIAA